MRPRGTSSAPNHSGNCPCPGLRKSLQGKHFPTRATSRAPGARRPLRRASLPAAPLPKVPMSAPGGLPALAGARDCAQYLSLPRRPAAPHGARGPLRSLPAAARPTLRCAWSGCLRAPPATPHRPRPAGHAPPGCLQGYSAPQRPLVIAPRFSRTAHPGSARWLTLSPTPRAAGGHPH